MACACTIVMLAKKDQEVRPDQKPGVQAGHPKGVKSPNRPNPGKNRTNQEIREQAHVDQPGSERPEAGVKKKPTFQLDNAEEKALNEEQRKTIAAIRAALDRNDRKEVLKLVQTLQKSDEWPDGIPKSIKLAAVDALGWFGSSCLPELAGFLADGDPEVVQAAIDRYQEMLSDVELSDFERAAILVQASRVIEDADAMDMMLFELNNMRHSVAINTIKQLMAVGNEATKSALPANVEFYTGEEGMASAQQLDEWLKKYPDDEADPEFYGGVKKKP